MKNLNRFGRNLITGLIAMAAAVALRAGAEAVPQVAQVVAIEGSAQYSVAGGPWMTLKKGDVLKPGTAIRTAEKSLVDVVLGDASATGSMGGGGGGSAAGGAGGGGGGGGGGAEAPEEKANVIRIFESSMLSVDKLTVDKTGVDEVSDTELDLRAGQVMANAKKLSKDSHFEIRIPNGVAGIHGSSTLVSSAANCETLYGEVILVVVGADNQTHTYTVSANHLFDPSTGLVSLIPPDVLAELLKIYHSLHGNFIVTVVVGPKDHTRIFISPTDGTASGGK